MTSTTTSTPTLQLQLQGHCITLLYGTLHPVAVGEVTTATTTKSTTPITFRSISSLCHPCISTSPIVSYLWNFPHRLARYYWSPFSFCAMLVRHGSATLSGHSAIEAFKSDQIIIIINHDFNKMITLVWLIQPPAHCGSQCLHKPCSIIIECIVQTSKVLPWYPCRGSTVVKNAILELGGTTSISQGLGILEHTDLKVWCSDA